MPGRSAFRDVFGRLVRASHGDVAILGGRGRLRSSQDGGHVLVRSPGLPRQRCRSFVALPARTKREERPGVEPEGAALVLVGRQQLLKRAVVASPQQAAGEEIPDPLVVVWVQPEHVAEVADRAVLVAELQQRTRQAGPGAHVGPRLEEAPELALIFLEALWPERQLSRLDPLGVEVPCLLYGPGGLLGQQDVGIGAERRDAE